MRVVSRTLFLTVLGVVLSCASASAQLLQFNYIGFIRDQNSIGSFSFEQDSKPIVQAATDGYLTQISEISTVNGVANESSAIFFYSIAHGGGFLFDSEHFAFEFQAKGDQIYSGTEESPVYAPSVFVLDRGVLTITSVASAVPELSSWAMMLLGFGGFGFLGYRKINKGDAGAVMVAA